MHQYVQHSCDIVFVDATPSLWHMKHLKKIFKLITVMPAGAVQLEVIVTSDETERTMANGLTEFEHDDTAFRYYLPTRRIMKE